MQRMLLQRSFSKCCAGTSCVGRASFSSMNASVLPHINGRMAMQTIDIPRPKAGEVLVKNRACGVCHTDLHIIRGDIAFPTPCVMGHETCGEIVELGPGVSMSASGSSGAALANELRVGDPVVTTFIMPCGYCPMCVGNNEDICETFFNQNRLKGGLYDGETRMFFPDGSPLHQYSMGGMAEYSVLPAFAAYRMPKEVVDMGTDTAIVGCALFTAYGAVKNAAQIQPGMRVAVFGAGGVGMNVMQICRAFGAAEVIAVDLDRSKLDFAKSCMGATQIVDARASADVVAEVKSHTPFGRGVDVAFEVVGSPVTFDQAVSAVGDGGKAVMVGLTKLGTRGSVDITRMVRRKITVQGSFGAKARSDTPVILDMLKRGVLSLESISKRYTLDQAADAFEDLEAGKIMGKAVVEF
mmetsp:Transcript_61217/g.197957  ORF Transcript_61217/g.197957 Transcript_61217/m.197957 type:complete len:410 (-) Transcript_61217:44-1273(-)